jgi:hypothetical protein
MRVSSGPEARLGSPIHRPSSDILGWVGADAEDNISAIRHIVLIPFRAANLAVSDA